MAYLSRSQPEVDANFVKLSILGPTVLSSATALLAFQHAFDLTVIFAYLRITGWFMLVTFMGSFGSSTILHFFPSAPAKWLLQNRKYFGVAFAVFIVFHIYGLYLKMHYDPVFFFQELTIPEFALGVLVIFFSLAMAFTSSAGMYKRLGANGWGTLHTWGGRCILLGFWVTYFDHQMSQFPIFLGINTLIILRCVRRLQKLVRDGHTSMLKLAAVTGLGFALCSLAIYGYDQLQSGFGPAVQKDKLYAVRDYFPLFEGNEWTYRVTAPGQAPTQRIYRIQEGNIISGQHTLNMHVTDNTFLAVKIDGYGIRLFQNVTHGRAFTYDPPGIYLPNLYLNQEKTFSAQVIPQQNSRAGTSPFEERALFRLRAIDSIEVASGRYTNCLRLEYELRMDDPNGGSRVVKGTSWLAPGVGKIKETRQIRIQTGDGQVLHNAEEELELVDVKIRKW